MDAPYLNAASIQSVISKAYFNGLVALTTDEDAVLGIVDAHALEVVVFNGSIVIG